MGIITKREEWSRKERKSITKHSQSDFIKTVFSQVSEEVRLLKQSPKPLSPLKTAKISKVLDGTWVEELPTSSKPRKLSTTLNSESVGVKLSALTVIKAKSELASQETCHQEPWEAKSRSCCIQTTNKTPHEPM